MKSRETLIRLKKFHVDERRRKVAQIEGMIAEFERMAEMGDVTPDLWMQNATGRPVGPEALLEAAQRALLAVSTNQ